MYFAVDPEDVEAAAVPLAHLANAVANIDLGADLAPLALALPTSSVAAALPELGARWAVWASGLRRPPAARPGGSAAPAPRMPRPRPWRARPCPQDATGRDGQLR